MIYSVWQSNPNERGILTSAESCESKNPGDIENDPGEREQAVFNPMALHVGHRWVQSIKLFAVARGGRHRREQLVFPD